MRGCESHYLQNLCHGRIGVDCAGRVRRLSNVANVKVLPMPMLPVSN